MFNHRTSYLNGTFATLSPVPSRSFIFLYYVCYKQKCPCLNPCGWNSHWKWWDSYYFTKVCCWENIIFSSKSKKQVKPELSKFENFYFSTFIIQTANTDWILILSFSLGQILWILSYIISSFNQCLINLYTSERENAKLNKDNLGQELETFG